MSAARSGAETIVFEPKDRALRRDVGWLGARLGELLRELASPGLFEIVERARLAARRRRKGNDDADAELAGIAASLAPGDALDFVRAFSAYFAVVNTAEQVHRLRRRADYARDGAEQPGSLRAAARALAQRGASVEEAAAAARSLLVEPVFTAHPTETVRRTLLKKHQRLARALLERRAGPLGRQRAEARILLEMASAWQTEEQLPGRPTVADEVEHVLFFLSEVLYRVVPSVHEELERSLEEAFGEPVPVPAPVLRFASWVGGDMDGNPNVGADTIRASLSRHLELVLRCYRDDLRELHEHLSQSTSRVSIAPAVLERVRSYADELPEDFAEVPARYSDMPYRQLLWLVSARLRRKGAGLAGGYGEPEAFRADVALIRDSLAENGGARAGLVLAQRTLRRIDVFGFHLAALDVRQDALVHRRAAGELIGDPDFEGREPAQRVERLTSALSAPPQVPKAGDELARTLEVFRAFAEARERFGARALGPFVVSMARGPDDALAVLLLARAGGCVDESGVPLDVAPLFETVDDLAAGPDVLRALAANPVYAQHLERRGRRQVVMLGYSDSNKDGGIAASRVALDRAQEQLVRAAEESRLRLTLFHGRGGSISRGGSKPRAGLLAAPPGALAGHARATEQGEIVGAKFGLDGIAERSLEVSLGALLERTGPGGRARGASAEQRAVGERLAQASRACYRALVHDDPEFPDLFRGMTPIDVIERLEIGSRPARRREMRGVQDLRAIPWVFAWMQCRAMLPGWFGVGTGLRAAIDEFGLAQVRSAARDWPFLATFTADVEMVLAKSDLEIASRYARLAGDVGARLFPVLVAEHERTVATLLEVIETPALLERDPTLLRSIRLRNPYVDPLSLVQVDALRRWREGGREDAHLERVLVQTVRGIARGLKNTG